MKAKETIRSALADWREIQNAPALAETTFGELDQDEVIRLAMRGYTDEIRAELRRKVDGVPVYTSVLVANEEGDKRRVYKQTAMFDIADYQVAIRFYTAEAKANLKVAKALVKDCQRRLGVQLPLPGVA
jgi:hypothetical protein